MSAVVVKLSALQKQQIGSALIASRRELHKIAEPAFNEWLTLNYLVNALKDSDAIKLSFIDQQLVLNLMEQGYAPLPVNQDVPALHFFMGRKVVIPGLCAQIKIKEEGKTIAIRADMDGLPIKESTCEDHRPYALHFASQGSCCHACAHDGHMAVALQLCRFIAQNKELLKDTDVARVRFIFQGAEEGCQGARIVAATPFLDGVDEIYCFHLGMGLKSGTVAANTERFLSTLKFDLKVTGKKAHAGHPQLGVNAGAFLCSFICKALKLMDPNEGRLINFSNIFVPGARNVIPDEASAQGELRALSSQKLFEVEQMISSLLDEHKQKFEGSGYAFMPCGHACEIQSDQRLIDVIGERALALGLKLEPSFAFNASEDASLLISKVQKAGGAGVYFVVGSDLKAPHHHSAFDFDENSLKDAFALLCEACRIRLDLNTP